MVENSTRKQSGNRVKEWLHYGIIACKNRKIFIRGDIKSLLSTYEEYQQTFYP